MHVQDICARANRLLGFILRSTRGLTSQKSLVLCPDLQKIQDKFVRVVGVRQSMNYREVPVNLISKELELSPLVVRRKLQDALFLFKLINDVIKCPELLQKINFRVSSGTRSQELVGCAISSSVDFFNSSLPAFSKKVMKILSEE
ncbi:hypothetical protein J6590_085679 [Homalodisca vitripennis]|nr:hypothetical protein J6590_085679 [Homalodisca vitripennis]